MLAVLDETSHEFPHGIAYVVAAAVLLEDAAAARGAMSAVIGSRKRPFHWHEEGPIARNAAVKAIIELGAVAHACIHYPTGRKHQDEARADAFRHVLPRLFDDGATRLLIESRGVAGDGRDRRTMRELLRARPDVTGFEYGWEGKSEPLLWIADAICGALRNDLLSPGDEYLRRLKAARVIGEPVYISP